MNKKSFIKHMSVLLACILFFALLPACKSDGVSDGDSADNKTTTGGGQEINSDGNSENVEINYYKNIPEGLKFNGEKFTFLTYQVDTWPTYVDVEEQIGETLNDAAYQRNTEVEELLGVDLETILMTDGSASFNDMVDNIRNDIAAGSNSYDLVIFYSNTSVAPLIGENLLYDWNKVPYVDLNADWYNQNANAAYTINNKQYLGVSDLTYPIQQHGRILFNKDLFKSLGLEMPYQTVYDGKWTLDALNGYIKNTYADLNGNGQKDEQDQFGVVAPALSLVARCVFNFDEFPYKIDSDGFKLNIMSDKLSNIMDKLTAFSNDANNLFPGAFDIFYAGRSVFTIFSSDPSLLRAIEPDFGYLPYPKYDENQPEYVTFTNGGHMGIPSNKSDEDMEFVGAVIEALSAASNKYVAGAFVQNYIESKILRDEDSVNIYHLMRHTAAYDYVRMFDASARISITLPYYTEILDKTTNLASQYEREGHIIRQQLDKFYETIINNQ